MGLYPDNKLGLLGALLATDEKSKTGLGAAGMPQPNSLANALYGGGLSTVAPKTESNGLGALTTALAGLASYVPPSGGPLGNLPSFESSLLGGLFAETQPPFVKRKAYFAFHYDDIMRVNNVRQAWKIKHPDNALFRSFYDSSLWEDAKVTAPDRIKEIIRDGVCYTSAVCVLVGTQTWSRRWVKYEIARAVIDKKGLLAVHLNSLNHNERRTPDVLGYNPLKVMGVFKDPNNWKLYLYEYKNVGTLLGGPTWEWRIYEDYTLPVSLPAYLPEPPVGYVMPLSAAAPVHDFYLQEGHKNIGRWIDDAAKSAGR